LSGPARERIVVGVTPHNHADDFDSLILQSIERAATGVIEHLDDRAPRPGQSIAQYVIVERLGEGGMGVVYKAEDTRLGRLVALKFVHPHTPDDAAGRAQLEREARAASALSHPCVCTVYDVDLQHERSFIAMELLEGETLRERLRRGPIPESRALEIVQSVASALGAAHERAVVHCDVKPANVFLTARGETKLLDFGIARQERDATTARTDSDSAAAGTRDFMSPEQARGETVDARSDIYALGVLLRRMMARPHWRVAHTIDRMTANDPAHRFQSMAEVVAALAKIQRRTAARSRRMAMAAAAIVVLTGALSAAIRF
jgi:serine/threonine protein kinase